MCTNFSESGAREIYNFLKCVCEYEIYIFKIQAYIYTIKNLN